MKIVQIHLFNKVTCSVEVFGVDDLPEEEVSTKYKVFAVYLEDGSVLSA